MNVTNPSQYKTVSVQLLRDDGAVVYVNGVEVVRDAAEFERVGRAAAGPDGAAITHSDGDGR